MEGRRKRGGEGWELGECMRLSRWVSTQRDPQCACAAGGVEVVGTDDSAGREGAERRAEF